MGVIYDFEYDIIPRFVAVYNRHLKMGIPADDKALMNAGNVILLLRDKNPDAVKDFSLDQLEISRKEIADGIYAVCYKFPRPSSVPEALYGVVLLTPVRAMYYTLEMSFNNAFVVGSITENQTHLNFGERKMMSLDDFVDEVCKIEGIDCKKNLIPQNSLIDKNNSKHMKRLKIDYGIDLGTTNSAISRMDKGEVAIIKSDTMKDTMPSCVSFTKKKSSKVGDSAYNDLKSDKRRATKTWEKTTSNVFIEFKRKMGTSETEFSSFMDKEYSAPELSAEVLKTLKSFVQDDEIPSVVITVPAKFNQNQKDATMKAAKLAGFEHCELLQEPIAAAMAYGLTGAEKDGLWLVFDFGGGTFDAALVRTEDGIMQVFDTEGNNYLGGKNLDEAIVDQIIIPYLQENFVIEDIMNDAEKKQILREAMKTYAEDVKNQLSFKASEDIISNIGDLGTDDEGTDIELDLTVTQDQLKVVIAPIFQKAVDICKKLLERNNLSGNQLSKIILVGGPTHSPVIRQMLREQIADKVDTSVDPMTVVASGAALYASTLDSNVEVKKEIGTVYLNLKYESTSVETTELVTVKLDKDQTTQLGEVFVEITRADKAWSSGKHSIDEVGDVIDVELVEGRSNAFTFAAYDAQGNSLPCYPDEITLIQGTVVGKAPLAYNVGIEKWDDEKEMGIFVPFKGLEKNKPLPAVGTINGLKTSAPLKPGCATDVIRIPIYEADAYEGKERASYFNLTYTILITGEMVPQFVPADSDVDLTFRCADSGWKLSAYFPGIDYTLDDVEIPKKDQSVSEDYLTAEISKGQATLQRLQREGCDTSEASVALSDVQTELSNGSEKHQVLTNLREALRKVDKCDSSSEWERLEKRLRKAFKMLEEDNGKYGNAKSTQAVEEVRKQVDAVIRTQNSQMAKDLLDVMHALNFQLARVEYYAAWISGWNRNFAQTRWSDSVRARQLVNQGMSMLSTAPTADALEPVVDQLINLLPDNDRPVGADQLLK